MPSFVHVRQTGTRGLDDIDGKIHKISAPIINDTLTYVYNLCILKYHISGAFKQAKVIFLFKSGNCSDPSNSRPITILLVLSKPVEKHINIFLHILTKNNLLHPNQSGFRQNHSCHTTLVVVVVPMAFQHQQ